METDKETTAVITSAVLTIVSLVAIWLYRRYRSLKKTEEEPKGR